MRESTGARATDPRAIEATTWRVRETATAFARAPLSRKVAALAEVRARLRSHGHLMARLGCEAKGIAGRPGAFAEELLAGAVITQRYVRLLGESLSQIRERGAPLVRDDRVRRLDSGEVAVQVMPHSQPDQVLFMPYQIEVWLAAAVDAADIRSAQAGFYRRSAVEGQVAAVLGAGNVASIPALDLLHECFVMGRACVLKMSPVNAYLGPIFEHVFAPVSELGGLAIVYGAAEAGKALLGSDAVDHVHMTGSTETHDRIVWGPPGPERERRLLSGEPLLRKSITSELGNISPALIVPGRYSEQELSHVTESIAGMLFNNASFNCNAVKLLVVPSSLAASLIDRLKLALSQNPARPAYYPGASARYAELTRAATAGELWHAESAPGQLPWTLLTGLNPSSPAESFHTEPFCPLLSVVEIDEDEPDAFLERAVGFVNEKVWGTLNAMLFVPSALEHVAEARVAVDRAIAELRYGTVAVNYWPAIGYGTGTPPWGGHPSASLADAQSGLGFVHNALMLERIQKVVLRGPLRSFPKPVYHRSHRQIDALARALFAFESTGSVIDLARTVSAGVRG